MTVLVLSDLWLPFPGGCERLAFNLTRHLHERGEQVAVLTGYWDHQPEPFPINASAIGIGPDHAVGAAIIADAVEHYRPDVILTHHLYAYEFEAELAETGIPVVHVVLNQRRLAGAALAVYISEWVRDQCGDAKPGDLVIHPPALGDVDASAWAGDHRSVGFIKPIPHKGVQLVYEIAAAEPDRDFLVLRGEWQTLEVLTDLPNVRYMDPVADIREFYAECRVVLMPSISEDAGTVAQECAVNGIPCISSDVGGLPETNAGGVILGSRDVSLWCDTLALLDDPDAYDMVADRQRSKQPDHTAALDEFADRVQTLAGS